LFESIRRGVCEKACSSAGVAEPNQVEIHAPQEDALSASGGAVGRRLLVLRGMNASIGLANPLGALHARGSGGGARFRTAPRISPLLSRERGPPSGNVLIARLTVCAPVAEHGRQDSTKIGQPIAVVVSFEDDWSRLSRWFLFPAWRRICRTLQARAEWIVRLVRRLPVQRVIGTWQVWQLFKSLGKEGPK